MNPARSTEARIRRTGEIVVARMARLQHVTEALSEAVTVAEVADVILGEGLTAVGAGGIELFRTVDGSTQLERLGARQPAWSPEAWSRFSADASSPLADAVARRTPLCFPSLADLVMRYPAASAVDPGGAGAFACFPLLDETRTLGGICAVYPEPHTFDEAEPAFLMTFGRLSAAALDRALLHEAEREARRGRDEAEAQLAEERHFNATLRSIGESLASELDEQKLLQKITDAATDIAGAQFGAFFYTVVDEAGGSLLLYTVSGVPREAFSRFPIPRETPLFGPTFRGECVIRLDDVTRDPRYGQNPPHHGMPRGHLPVRSYLAVPVKARSGEVLGALFFGHSKPGRFTETHERMVSGVVAPAAIAIENARLYQQAQSAIRTRDEFLAMLAHELRNPLAPAVTGLHLIRMRGSTAPFEKELNTVERQINNIARLVDDLLDVSRITRNKIELRKERIDLGAALLRAVETVRPLIDSRRHTVSFTSPGAPIEIDADPVRIEQVFSNLLNNAAKYTPPGGHLELFTERRGDDVLVRVRDDGVGMAADVLPSIFEPFTQAKRSLDRAQGGLGLGLTLVKRLVEMHGGAVYAKSEGAERGSEFTVRLPIPSNEAAVPRPEATAKERAQSLGAASLRVLVVDDNVDAAETLSEAMRVWGHEVWTANQPEQAISTALERRPHLALIDIGLPGMDGYELVRRLRLASPRAETRYVAVSGYGQAEDRRRSLEAGFDDHLVKPVAIDVLQTVIREVVSSLNSPGSAPPA